MNTDLKIILLYLFAINNVAFFAFGIDKLKAKRDKWRIPESTLLSRAVLGGSIGALAGMKVWRHKTLHDKFRIGIPVIITLQIAAVVWWIFA